MTDSAAVIGAAGGVGTTRTTVEAAAALARDDRDVLVLDAAVGTQGLAGHAPGRLDPDLTRVVAGDAALADATVTHPADVPGRLALCPAAAPFERLAAALAPEAGEAFADLLAAGTAEYDHVLVDTPPVASNLAVAGATAADRAAVLTEPTTRGRDALQRARDRLADVGAPPDLVVYNRADDADVPDADATLPTSDHADVPEQLSCVRDEPEYAPAVAATAAALLDADLDAAFGGTSVVDAARRYLS